jgi:hypothetical protein
MMDSTHFRSSSTQSLSIDPQRKKKKRWFPRMSKTRTRTFARSHARWRAHEDAALRTLPLADTVNAYSARGSCDE